MTTKRGREHRADKSLNGVGGGGEERMKGIVEPSTEMQNK